MRGYDNILFDMTSQARNNYKMIEDILNRPEMKMLKSCHVTKMSIQKCTVCNRYVTIYLCLVI